MDPEKEKIYIVGNWKMNPVSLDDAEALFDEIENDIYKLSSDNVEVVVCPPYLFLSEFDGEGRVKLGAQDVFWEKEGAFTGELSADMLRRAGVKYSIVGHSERRGFLLETDEMVNKKVQACLEGKLRPILCVGETLEERRRGDTGEVIIRQIEKALWNIPEDAVAGKLLIAYEPVWSIGSGLSPSNDEIMSVGLLIKKTLGKVYGSREISSRVPILYGGSVSLQNYFDHIDKTGFDGLLIGGASIRPGEFLGIVKGFARLDRT